MWPFDPGAMFGAKGVNRKSTIDPEKELRKHSGAITSTKLEEHKKQNTSQRAHEKSGVFGKDFNLNEIIAKKQYHNK